MNCLRDGILINENPQGAGPWRCRGEEAGLCAPWSSLQSTRLVTVTQATGLREEERRVWVQESLQGNQFQLQLEKLRRGKPWVSGREVMKNCALAVNLSRLSFKGPTWLWLFSSGAPTQPLGWGQVGTACQVSSSIRLEIKCTNECDTLESPWNHPPHRLVCGKIVFHETGPWCQKGWGPLL